MILVDVQVIQLGMVYDFELDEDKTIREVVEDIVLLICKKERLEWIPGTGFYLYSMSREGILSFEATFKEMGIRNGERLVLICTGKGKNENV